jgi:hypothetical protein
MRRRPHVVDNGCLICGSRLRAPLMGATRVKKSKYCSYRCYRLDSGIWTVCLQCGILFKHCPSQPRKFCTYECHLKSGGARRAGDASVKARMKYGAKKDANHHDLVNALERIGCGVLDLSSLGYGVPDLLILDRNKNMHLADVKNKKTSYGRRGMNNRQKEFAANWQGTAIYLLYTIDDALNLGCGRIDQVKSVPCGIGVMEHKALAKAVAA